MNRVVLLFPSDLDKDQRMLLKNLGEQEVSLLVDRSHVSSLLQFLNTFYKSSSVNLDVRKGVKDLSAIPAPVADQRTQSHRRRSEERASNGSEDSAGEARRSGSVEQHMSAVHRERSTACDRSSPGAAAGTGVQHTGSNITKPQRSVGGPEQRRGGESERASKRSGESTAGAASAGCSAKQQVCKDSRGSKALHNPKTKEAEQAGSKYASLLTFRGSCFNCGGQHHNHLCLENCKRCKDGPPCQCKCWRWRQRQKRSSVEPAVVPPAVTIPEFEESRSCSKKKAYQELCDFVQGREYIWQLVESSEFTEEEEGELRALLLGMREEDRSGLYQRAYNYLESFRVGEEDLVAFRKWRELEEQARRRQSKKVVRQKAKRGPPAEPVVKPVPATSVSASSVSKVLTSVPKGLTAEQAIAATQARKAAASSVSLSGLEKLASGPKSVPREVSACRDSQHKTVGSVPARPCSLSVSVSASGSAASPQSNGGTSSSVLYSTPVVIKSVPVSTVSESTVAKQQMCSKVVNSVDKKLVWSSRSSDRLPDFISRHPEMRFRMKYDPSFAWSVEIVRELHGILSEVDPDSELGSTTRYSDARIFYRHMCQVLQVRQSSLQPAGRGVIGDQRRAAISTGRFEFNGGV